MRKKKSIILFVVGIVLAIFSLFLIPLISPGNIPIGIVGGGLIGWYWDDVCAK